MTTLTNNNSRKIISCLVLGLFLDSLLLLGRSVSAQKGTYLLYINMYTHTHIYICYKYFNSRIPHNVLKHPYYYFTLLISSIFISLSSLKKLPPFVILFLQIDHLYPAISLPVASQPCNNPLYFLASSVTTGYILKSRDHIFFVNILSPFLSIFLFLFLSKL